MTKKNFLQKIRACNLIDAIKQIEEIREARLRATSLFTLNFALIMCVIFLFRSLQWELYGRVLSLTTCSSFLLISIIILRKGGSRTMPAILGIIGCSIAVGYSAYSSGGLGNPAYGWLIALPLTGALLGGKKGAVAGFFVSLATALGLVYLEYGTHSLPNLTPIIYQQSQDRLNQLGQLIIVSLCIINLFKQIKFSEVQLSDFVIKLSNEVDARTLAEQKAEKANQIKSEFLANMSHEVRTPMNGIIGMLNILQKEKLNEKQSNYLELAKSSSDTLLVVINDILDLSKIESGKLQLEKKIFNLAKLFKDTVQIKTLNASKKGLYLHSHTDLRFDWVIGDPTRLRQVIENLLSNAIKFTEEGGVELAVSLTPTDVSTCLLTVKVSDTGVGISPKKLNSLFTPFQQMESSTTRRFGGTGLGLSISKQLITLMNGDIEVSSEEHKGSIFLFSLKLNVPEVDDIQEEVCNSRVPPNLHQDHIYPVLLVEDNEINILVALTILEGYPLKVDVAKNGIQAIEMINRNYLSEDSNYCAIFMDCQMPKMDGYETSTILRQRPEFKDLPIIAMTAHAMKGDREKCLVAGMSDYITKPVEPKILEEKLSQWLSINIG